MLRLLWLPMFPLYVLYLAALELRYGGNMWHLAEADQEKRGSDMRLIPRFVHLAFYYLAYSQGSYFSGDAKVNQKTTLSKDHWRSVLRGVGAFVAPELARWKDGCLEWFGPLDNHDLVVKPESGALNSGSAMWANTKNGGTDFSTKEDVSELMLAHAKKQLIPGNGQYLVLAKMSPARSMGCHNFQIITAMQADGRVGVLWVTLKRGPGLHTFPDWSRLDPSTGTVLGPDPWLRLRKMWSCDRDWFGKVVPGAVEACDMAVKAHRAELEINPRRAFVGWDAMLMDDGRIIFFEGNTCTLRLGRVIYASWAATAAFLRNFVHP